MTAQAVIQKSRNVVLEENSGYDYMRSFRKRCKREDVAYFIAATGVNKAPCLVYMFIGWRWEFIVVIDNDTQGRGVFNQVLKTIFRDDDVEGESRRSAPRMRLRQLAMSMAAVAAGGCRARDLAAQASLIEGWSVHVGLRRAHRVRGGVSRTASAWTT